MSCTVTLEEAPNEPQTLFYRDINQCIDWLMGNPAFSGKMAYAPVQIYQSDGSRVYHEMNTGTAWWDLQAKVRQPFEARSFS